MKRLIAGATLSVCLFFSSQEMRAGDLKIRLPKGSKLTPVQQLNREGVEAIRKHHYDRAKTLFYKAYLFDPDDPFTLNNLGYISELEGQVERAERFYALASEQASEAVIDRASARRMEGKTLREVAGAIQDTPMQINRSNVEAIRLLAEGRGPEAETILQRTLTLDPHNVFTLNNLGVAKEMQGEYEEALKYYNLAASSQSTDPAVVTLNNARRGESVSQISADSMRKLNDYLEHQENTADRVARLNLQGVSSINRNDWASASQDFLKAYSLDPENAFTLNNLGYVAEMNGDAETAQFFYERARRATGANARVGYASRPAAEGKKLFEVADDSDQKVATEISEERDARRRQHPPIQLRHRDNTPVIEPESPPQTNPSPDQSRPPQ